MSPDAPDTEPAKPSVWAAGDPPMTHEELAEQGVGGGQVVDPKDQRIAELEAQLAEKRAEDVPHAAPSKSLADEILTDPAAAPLPTEATPPVEAEATTVDPRDEEIADLERQLAERAEPQPVPEAPTSETPAAP